LRPVYEGHFYQLFKPFALLARVLSVVMLAMHGAVLLAWRTDRAVAQRAHNWGRLCALLTVVLFIAGGFWVTHLDGHVITSALDVHAPSNPLLKIVEIQEGAWMLNYAKWPLAWLAPGLGVAGATSAFVMLSGRWHAAAFLSSALSIVRIILTVGVSLFPFLMSSSLADPRGGLTVWDASSRLLTLWIMLLAVCIFLPIVTAYTTWVYRVMRGTVTH
jgi:cytochrome d ubiquinol oxidase subunit II